MDTYKPNSLAVKAPWLEKEWHPDNDKKFWEVTRGSEKKYTWTCPKGHIYTAAPFNRARVKTPTGCPECCGKRVSVMNSLATKTPELEKEWHPDNNKKFHEVSYGSTVKYKWICIQCKWTWTISPSHRASAGKSGCPRCCGHVVSDANSLTTKAPWLECEWHSDNAKRFCDVHSGSNKKFQWECSKCQHVWWAPPNNRTGKNRRGCPACAEAVTDANSLAAKAPHLKMEWHPDNDKESHEVAFASSKKRKWICVNGHVWWAQPANRTSKAASRCPDCIRRQSKSELALYGAIKATYVDAVSGRRGLLQNKRLEIDIYVPSLKKAIEYNGVYWHSLPPVRERDALKEQQCAQAGIQLLSIPEAEYEADPLGTITKALEWLRAES
jgi:hypothetical protein